MGMEPAGPSSATTTLCVPNWTSLFGQSSWPTCGVDMSRCPWLTDGGSHPECGPVPSASCYCSQNDGSGGTASLDLDTGTKVFFGYDPDGDLRLGWCLRYEVVNAATQYVVWTSSPSDFNTVQCSTDNSNYGPWDVALADAQQHVVCLRTAKGAYFKYVAVDARIGVLTDDAVYNSRLTAGKKIGQVGATDIHWARV